MKMRTPALLQEKSEVMSKSNDQMITSIATTKAKELDDHPKWIMISPKINHLLVIIQRTIKRKHDLRGMHIILS
jgi:hypothetical protein